MKKILIFTASLVVAVSAFAQGTVNFANNVTGALVTRVYDFNPASPATSKIGNTTTQNPVGSTDYTGHTLLAGTGFTVQLWGRGNDAGGARAEGDLQLMATSTFRTGTAAGILTTIANPTVMTPDGPLVEGQRGTFQLRAWNNGNGARTTWQAAMDNWSTFAAGKSGVFSPNAPLGNTPVAGQPPAGIPNLLGLTSFNLYIVPEPSSIALGVLGLGSLMLLRRRK